MTTVGQQPDRTSVATAEHTTVPGQRPPGQLRRVTGTITRRVRPFDAAVAALFLLAAHLLYVNLWSDLAHGYLTDSGGDQNQAEWFMAIAAENIAHLHNPFFTTVQGFPDGVNLMANTVMLGLTVPLTPITLAFGPTVTYALVLTWGLAGTGIAWYWVLGRWAVRSRPAAAVGAALAAFAPPMISHGNAHPNFTALFMIPLIVDRALCLCRGDRVVRDAVLLGLFTAYQIFIGEEVLLIAAVGMLLFAAAYALADPGRAREAARPLRKGLPIALAMVLPLVAGPLYVQFLGPGSYTDVPHGYGVVVNSPLSFLQFAGRSLAGNEAIADRFAVNRLEQNAFYGWPLAGLALVIAVRLWHRALVKALVCTAIGGAVLSMGPRIQVPGTHIVLPGPWRLILDLPLFGSVIESRFGMVCAPVLGVLVALAVDRITASSEPRLKAAGLVAVAAALLPIVPTPYPVNVRPAVPDFIADGTWRRYVDEGQTVVPVPLAHSYTTESQHWQSATRMAFTMPGGYFMAPNGPAHVGNYNPEPRPTYRLLGTVYTSGKVPEIGPRQRAEAEADLSYWKAGVVVLAPGFNAPPLYQTLRQLLGRDGTLIGGAWVWDVNDGTSATRRPGA
ncbi:glycosyltransferase family 2 protein [Streptomyces albidocamelliae]|uniref:Glycosyltransferase family 2 protein n=1 Tax=Streptomyces albidocamelliae TaxID=2981135 RepID=A0ABY6ET08_9ACTN|nr:glycosyltransferase family 2 protein [Streptomyces sp. HUAS 14-6]UXY37532.1 glycosyltransferase family 2 protein [Streptomyces sp. HUAS 14-6]